MSQLETLMARDGHTFDVYIARPPGRPRGGIVIAQEIFGLTPHIRRVADGYAADGYLVIAPALFDRIRRDLVLGYSPQDLEQARGYYREIRQSDAVLDIAAAAAAARHCGKVAVIGYCWGATLAWVSAGEIPVAAAVCYYGSGIATQLERLPDCPALLHFGERDSSTPAEDIERIRAAFPQGQYWLYPAGHAFNNEDRPNYDAASAGLARSRTLAFLARHVG